MVVSMLLTPPVLDLDLRNLKRIRSYRAIWVGEIEPKPFCSRPEFRPHPRVPIGRPVVCIDDLAERRGPPSIQEIHSYAVTLRDPIDIDPTNTFPVLYTDQAERLRAVGSYQHD